MVVVLLLAVLVLSWWAKGTNFNFIALMQNLNHPQPAASAAPTNQAAATPTPIPVEILITVTPNGFVPDAIMIARNTKITWVNKTPSTVNVTSDPQGAYSPLNLGDFDQNGSVSLVFTTVGRYHYYNNKNPNQKGTIIVR